ncbi:MAG: carbohydrate binding module family protein, partial [Phycisphaerales bacterium]|nr:carbohydrate binding module family protein [Phycisphaerales bacterium]
MTWALIAGVAVATAFAPESRAGDLGVDVNADVDAFGKDQMSIGVLTEYGRTHTAYALPMFNQPPGDHVRYWDNMVEQYQSAQIDFIAVWLKGNDQPATFANLVKAVDKRGLTDRIKIMPFDDNPASWTAMWNFDHGNGYGYKVPFDISTPASWGYVWDKNLKAFFQNVPDANRYKIDGRPVYRVWSAAPAFLSNVAGNGSKLLRYLRE